MEPTQLENCKSNYAKSKTTKNCIWFRYTWIIFL